MFNSENGITREIVGATIEVHRTLGGPGLLESVYEESLSWEMSHRGLLVERQLQVPISYKGNPLTSPLRLDMLVEKKVIVECKATTQYNKIFEAQLLTYLRLLDLRVGLVINFGEKYVKRGIHRVVNKFDQ
ncbi:MAG: Fe3+ hydroxamate ABC transporter substrate-binding protein [Anaerolineaceae bacterium]|nr:Fe3+ hydroxamate ABC transporter substrate-binding protein [Anaerolineaceae bacterium]